MKRITVLILALLTLCLCFAGCSEKQSADDDSLSIVVTAFPHYDFARQITKGVPNVNIKMLISPGSEVHTYEPSPSDILAISGCDLFIYTGGESDTWVKKILGNDGEKNIVSFMDVCSPNPSEETEQDGHDHDHEYDEHVWTSPVKAKMLVSAITEKMCEIDTDGAEIYKENEKEFLAKLSETDKALWEISEGSVRDKIIVADRFPFYHLAHDYGIEYESAYSGCSSATEPSAAIIASLSEKVKNEEIPYVFTIEFSNGKIANSIISGTDTEVLTLHSCHNVSAEDFEKGVTYYDLMMSNAANLRKALCE